MITISSMSIWHVRRIRLMLRMMVTVGIGVIIRIVLDIDRTGRSMSIVSPLSAFGVISIVCRNVRSMRIVRIVGIARITSTLSTMSSIRSIRTMGTSRIIK